MGPTAHRVGLPFVYGLFHGARLLSTIAPLPWLLRRHAPRLLRRYDLEAWGRGLVLAASVCVLLGTLGALAMLVPTCVEEGQCEAFAPQNQALRALLWPVLFLLPMLRLEASRLGLLVLQLGGLVVLGLALIVRPQVYLLPCLAWGMLLAVSLRDRLRVYRTKLQPERCSWYGDDDPHGLAGDVKPTALRLSVFRPAGFQYEPGQRV